MAQISLTRGKSCLAGEFTLPGKCWRSDLALVGLRSVAAFLMLFALGDPAAALQQIGPTSSASVGISLSVAPKYVLRANGARIRAQEKGAAGLCMMTNGQPMDLPVNVVRQAADVSAPGQTLKEAATLLHWCAAGGRTKEAIDRSDHGEEAALLIVRPE